MYVLDHKRPDFQYDALTIGKYILIIIDRSDSSLYLYYEKIHTFKHNCVYDSFAHPFPRMRKGSLKGT